MLGVVELFLISKLRVKTTVFTRGKTMENISRYSLFNNKFTLLVLTIIDVDIAKFTKVGVSKVFVGLPMRRSRRLPRDPTRFWDHEQKENRFYLFIFNYTFNLRIYGIKINMNIIIYCALINIFRFGQIINTI